jgi:hypothetical protein
VLLGCLACFVDKLATFSSPLCEFFGLVLDLGVETLEHGEDGALDGLCCFGVRVGDALMLLSFHVYLLRLIISYLGVAADGIKSACNTAQVLVKVVAFLEGV